VAAVAEVQVSTPLAQAVHDPLDKKYPDLHYEAAVAEAQAAAFELFFLKKILLILFIKI
jgi:hypothetical protein